ncbi:uncharacterized protein TRIADDRAFT_32666, partial [Trichoplax adhaerens]
FCCIVPAKIKECSVTEFNSRNKISNCHDLLANPSLRIFTWIVSILAVIGNALVILLYRRDSKAGHPVPKLVVSHLAFADFLMGLYLLIIAIADMLTRHDYGIYSVYWNKHPMCLLASFLMSLSSFMSVFMMLLIGIDRYICIVYPFSNKRLDMATTKKTLGLAWVISIGYIAGPIVYSINKPYTQTVYGDSPVCVPINLSHKFFYLWLSSYIFLTFLMWIIVTILYIRLFIKVKQSGRSIRRNQKTNQEHRMAIRLFLICITDIVCWLPFYFVFWLSVIQIRRGEAHSYLNSGFSVILRFTILPYVVVFALPINSAINPFLYTFTSSNFTDRLPGWCKMDRSKWPLFGSLSSLNQSSKSNSSLTISSPSERIQSSASIDSKS